MSDLHDRILTAAYPLFVHRGVRGVSLYEVQDAAGVSASEFDEEFPSRDALAEEVLRLREREWTIGTIAEGARRRGVTPEGKILAIFDVFDEWFHRDDYEACTFVNTLLEMGRDHRLGRASVEHLLHIRNLIADIATEAGLRDAEDFACSCQIIMKGAIISAVEGDHEAAMRGKEMARDLIARHRTASLRAPAHTDVDWFDACQPDSGYLPAPREEKPAAQDRSVFFAESIQPTETMEAEADAVEAPPVVWSAVRHDLWVGNHDGEFAGMVELIHGAYWATSRHGRPSGSYPTLRQAEEALEWEQIHAGHEGTTIFGV
ncbi:TetR/AcrR family transcriptional regulator [Microbacteriaceae bacterium 4G12]